MKDEPWDYISFQQASPLSGQYNTYTPYLTELIKYVRQHTINPNVEIIFHITWAYAQNSTHEGFANYGKDQLSMYNAILSTAKKALEDNNIRIFVPAGTAIQNGRTSSWEIRSARRFHLNSITEDIPPLAPGMKLCSTNQLWATPTSPPKSHPNKQG